MADELDIKALGLSLGILWAACVFLLGIAATLAGMGTPLVNAIASLYAGYESTFLGSVIGAIYAFIDGFIGGVVIAWLYNKFQ